VLGPADGRYVVRGPEAEEAEHVLIMTTLGAPQRRRLGRRRPRAVEPEPEPAAVPTSRATVIIAEPLQGAAPAQAWLRAGRGDEAETRLADAVLVLNRTLAAHRVAAADPALRDVARDQALVARLGYGSGDEVADGHWTDAVEVPLAPRRARRTAALRPQERLAALIGGRAQPLACEELVLRARSDLDRDATREAALQLRIALEAALAELPAYADVADLAERTEELRASRGEVGDAANAALAGPLDPAQAETVARVTGRLEAALRAKSAAGFA
jgi:hypothetical protein